MREGSRRLGWIVAVLAAACGAERVGQFGADAGTGGGGDAGEVVDGGRPRLAWPSPSLTVEGVSDSYLVQPPGGERTLLYAKDGKLVVHRGAPAGAPLAVADGAPEVLAAHPTADRIFVAWGSQRLRGLTLAAGQPEGAPVELLATDYGLELVGAGWIAFRPPMLLGYTGAWSMGSEQHPPMFLGFTAPVDPPPGTPLGEPKPEQALEPTANPYRGYDEQHRLLDLGDGSALCFRTHMRVDPDDPQSGKLFAFWYHLVPSGRWLVARRQGYLELPGGGTAIAAHALGEGRYALTWERSESSLVSDVWIAGLAIDAQGTPSLTTAPVNVSMTYGIKEQSDLARVLPAGDGRVWLAWRERYGGPMVALLDADLRVRAITGPPGSLGYELNESAALGAAVDAQGTLHLSAGFTDGGARMRYFEIPRP